MTSLELSAAWAVDLESLSQALLDTKPQVVHSSGHGESGGIVFERELHDQITVGGEALADIFAQFADSLRCVVLNGYCTAEHAAAIAARVPQVIGMEQEISDTDAILFSFTFYRAIGAGRDIGFAFRLPRSTLAAGRCSEAIHVHCSPRAT